MQRRSFIVRSTAAAIGLPAAQAQAQQAVRIAFGYTATAEFATVFVAAEEGMFRKRNLDVELKFIPLNSTIPAAIQSGSLQMGGPTPSVFLQAVDGGLDHVVVAGAGATARSLTSVALVARAGSGIRTAADCVNRKIGVPGLGAFLHVTFRAWLKLNGVDFRKVGFVETAFPQHGDLLRSGSIDAVVTADPFLSRITETGAAYVASYYTTFLAEGMPNIVHTATRAWAQQNTAAARAFRDALVEAAAFVRSPPNDATVRAAVGKHIKVPPEVLARMQISPPLPVVNQKHLEFWLRLMREQDMLRGSPDVRSLILG